MLAILIIFALTSLGVIFSVLFNLKITLGKININLYWIIALIGAIFAIIFKCVSFNDILEVLTSDSSVNPLKILTLFLCLTAISTLLDELGLFKFIAEKILLKVNKNQIKLFLAFYFIVAFFTVFTSNDIVILTFTPFICYLTKNLNINPVPYVVAEFTSANTWSLLFIIGNPTNIYIATAFNIDFINYFKIMALPTIVCGIVSLSLLLLIFRKTLKKPIEISEDIAPTIINKPLCIIDGIFLIITTVLLAVCNYISLEMWIVCLIAFFAVYVFTLIFLLCQKKSVKSIFVSFKRLPYAIIPFLLSFFILIIGLDKSGVLKTIAEYLSNFEPTFSYGFLSFIFSDIINNIPMSVLFTALMQNMQNLSLGAVYASIIGSNLGAILTPLGALAGIMWMNILHKENIDFKFSTFIKYGVIISIPTITFSLTVLFFIV